MYHSCVLLNDPYFSIGVGEGVLLRRGTLHTAATGLSCMLGVTKTSADKVRRKCFTSVNAMTSTKSAFFHALDELVKSRPEIVMYDPDRDISNIRELVVSKLKELGDEKHAIIVRKKNTSVIRNWFREWKGLKIREYKSISRTLSAYTTSISSTTTCGDNTGIVTIINNTGNVQFTSTLNITSRRQREVCLVEVPIYDRKLDKNFIFIVPVENIADPKKIKELAMIRALYWYIKIYKLHERPDLRALFELLRIEDEFDFAWYVTMLYWDDYEDVVVLYPGVKILYPPSTDSSLNNGQEFASSRGDKRAR